MSTFGEDLIQSLNEALAHANDEGAAVIHSPVTPREVRKQAKLTQAQMAPLMGMSLSGYPQVGTGSPASQRTGGDTATGDPEGARGGQACTPAVLTRFHPNRVC